MSHRKLQIESTLKRAVATTLSRDVSDPRIEGMVSVVSLECTPDMRTARVGVSVLPEKKQRATLAGLRHAAAYIHSLVCKRVDLKTVPHLDFVLDESLKNEAKVYDAIRRGLDMSGPDEANDPAVENPKP
jgi:ribosome-binding factor A